MTRRNSFFERWSWFKFNNLDLALVTNLKFYTSVKKGLKGPPRSWLVDCFYFFTLHQCPKILVHMVTHNSSVLIKVISSSFRFYFTWCHNSLHFISWKLLSRRCRFLHAADVDCFSYYELELQCNVLLKNHKITAVLLFSEKISFHCW